MRILFLTQWFQPEPFFKGLGFAKELQERGHNVEVVTGFPNYPGGVLYPGYRQALFRRQMIDGVRVLRLPLYPSHDTSSLKRALNYLTFAISTSILAPLLAQRADVAYVYHPPGTIALPALTLRRFRRLPFVIDIQDLWPDSIEATGMVRSRLVVKFVDAWLRIVYKGAAAIAVLSPGVKRKLVERGVPADKVEVIYNWCDEDAIRPQEPSPDLKRKLGLAGRFNVVFAGTIGIAQGLHSVLDAAAILQNELPDIQFVFVGGGVDVGTLKDQADAANLSNALFLPRMEPEDASRVLAAAHVLLVHLKDDPLFRITIPSKTQAYLAMGRPILMAVEGDAADLVARAGAGLRCKPGDPVSIADAVRKLYEMPIAFREKMGVNGRSFYESELALDRGVSKFEECLLKAIEG